ncbi:hypothetical protein J6590_018229 [Homalodisca vitripennis]|nr:hypothetical protein J6590_018229 [Homalodisca vitripennis]
MGGVSHLSFPRPHHHVLAHQELTEEDCKYYFMTICLKEGFTSPLRHLVYPRRSPELVVLCWFHTAPAAPSRCAVQELLSNTSRTRAGGKWPVIASLRYVGHTTLRVLRNGKELDKRVSSPSA